MSFFYLEDLYDEGATRVQMLREERTRRPLVGAYLPPHSTASSRSPPVGSEKGKDGAVAYLLPWHSLPLSSA